MDKRRSLFGRFLCKLGLHKRVHLCGGVACAREVRMLG